MSDSDALSSPAQPCRLLSNFPCQHFRSQNLEICFEKLPWTSITSDDAKMRVRHPFGRSSAEDFPDLPMIYVAVFMSGMDFCHIGKKK